MVSSAASAGSTARVSILVQRGDNFIAAGPSKEDHLREDCAARATVVLARSRSFTIYLAPLDMTGMTGMTQTLGACTNGVAGGESTPQYADRPEHA